MTSKLAYRSKVEKFALDERCLTNRNNGMSDTVNAKDLSKYSGENITSSNVSSFLKSIKRGAERTDAVAQQLNIKRTEVELKTLDNWQIVDNELTELLARAKEIQEKIVGVDKKSGEPIIINYTDLRLWKDVVAEIAKIIEIKARVLGQIRPSTQNITYNIDKQFNTYQNLIIEAEKIFPGINKWFEEQLRKKEGL